MIIPRYEGMVVFSLTAASAFVDPAISVVDAPVSGFIRVKDIYKIFTIGFFTSENAVFIKTTFII
ncbi:hypothetical protein SDC9_92399 [bioreactor metagenome]|uniref:Uncharacterized protein n=1 Tax=bioreactor metagenome TaxID=1076179 RepID=A0A644ZZ54_9ZZZZ